MKDKTTCTTCGIKSRCIKQNLSLYYLFYATGRADEVTDSVREKFDCGGGCKIWRPISDTKNEESSENH